MAATNPSRMDDLTRTVTAFDTWAEFEATMQAGYCPTLRPTGGKGRGQRAWNAAVVELAAAVRAAGYPVFDGARVN